MRNTFSATTVENLLNQSRKICNQAEEFLAILSSPGDNRDINTASQEYQLIAPQVRFAEYILRYDQDLKDLELMKLAGLPGAEEEREKTQKKFNEALLALYELSNQRETDRHFVTVEIKPGVGGDEAALFAGDLFGMYCNYADFKGWKYTVSRLQIGETEGIKEAIIDFDSYEATSIMQLEAGVHRVQRIPQTESMGRVHTSTAVICVLPRISNPQINIDKKDLEIQRCRSSGPGGQSVNTSDSAITILHIPTGIRVSQQDERSQRQNQEKAMATLKQRLLLRQQTELADKLNAQRSAQSAGGDRADKIRTYHFPQNRITDHRYQISAYNLKDVLQGQERLEEFLIQIQQKSQEDDCRGV